MKLWYGGKIYTMIQEGDWVEAIVVRDGRVIASGETQDLYDTYKEEIEEEYDLKGHVMYPGFVDSHLHIIGHGERLIRLDLSFMKSAEEVIQALKQHAAQLPDGQWIIGEGWNENQWEDPRIIHRDELDEISQAHPIMLSRVCRHALLANSKAIQLAGVDDSTHDPYGGVIVKDESGRVNGYFHEKAQELIKQAMPPATFDYLTHATELALQNMYQNGLTGGHTEDLNYYGGFKQTYDAFTHVIDGKACKFRAHLLVHHEVVDDMVKEGLGYKQGTEFVELGAMKIFADGAIGGRTAWLREAYSDQPGHFGVAIHDEHKFTSLVQQARHHRMPVAIHAIGDQALKASLKAVHQFPLTTGERDRIIHAQIFPPEFMSPLKNRPIIFDIQPAFVASDFPWVMERIGRSRLKHSYSWKTMIDAGLACAGGSDAPIEEINPLLGMRAAVERRAGPDQKIYQEEEQLSIYEAVALYTKGSAYAIGYELERGQIAPGFVADFTVLDRDLFTLNSHELADAVVSTTIVDGDVMYNRL
ncbi:amidohydrolase [Thalassobacillus sp. CUG 92003]|uniref:amidohydrolase n=1 Tax=Thalassobacillus sp. CUG 92003 TaxID=2736641 RepID=UPI0015E6AF32|nr:amidohydrolase [Thalassobacillus sp. CUG 92003]